MPMVKQQIDDTDSARNSGRNSPVDDAHVIRVLRRIAKRKGQALTWNRNVLLATYAALTATVVVALRVQNAWVIAPAGAMGLIMIWAFNALQAKKIEDETLDDEIRDYQRLIAPSATKTENTEPVPLAIPSMKSPLSCRESEVLNQIAAGKSNKQAALDLYISEQTVKNHIKHIFTKLEVGDRSSAILLAVRNGWVDADNVGRWHKSWASEEAEESSVR